MERLLVLLALVDRPLVRSQLIARFGADLAKENPFCCDAAAERAIADAVRCRLVDACGDQYSLSEGGRAYLRTSQILQFCANGAARLKTR